MWVSAEKSTFKVKGTAGAKAVGRERAWYASEAERWLECRE